MDNIYIIGHKSPDLDSVAAAICYANLKNNLTNTNKFIPKIAGKINQETKYILEKFNFETPQILENANDKKIVLVDHNESSQSITGIQDAQILEILDHHKVNFDYKEAIKINIEPWGASCTIIADLYFQKNINLDKNQASLLLAAILVDTVITKSPTCTKKDLEIINKLSKIADIKNWKNFGMDIFKVRSSVSNLNDLEIIQSDFKDFEFTHGKIGVGQVETVDLSEFENRKKDLLNELEKQKNKNNYHTIILFITDILQEGSLFLIVSDEMQKIAKTFQVELENKTKTEIFIPGIMSRKKQVAPKLTKNFN